MPSPGKSSPLRKRTTPKLNGPDASRLRDIDALVSSPPKLQQCGDALIDGFRELIIQRSGRGGFVGLTQVLRVMDSNGDKRLSPQDFSDGLQSYGLKFTKTDVDKLFKFLDRDLSGNLTVDEFIRGVRPEMPMGRKDLVMQAYKVLDVNGDGKVRAEEIKKLFDASHHPAVLTGKQTIDDIYKEFVSCWDTNGDALITPDEFMEYYTNLSAGIHNDAFFELMLRNSWHISGGEGSARNTSCMRVLVKFLDGRQQVIEIKNDLRLKSNDVEGIKERLKTQGFENIVDVATK